nr:beta-galactosidase [Streptomyces canus]
MRGRTDPAAVRPAGGLCPEQCDPIRELSDRPVTTNLMLPYYERLDLWAFARELDVVTSDQHPSV